MRNNMRLLLAKRRKKPLMLQKLREFQKVP